MHVTRLTKDAKIATYLPHFHRYLRLRGAGRDDGDNPQVPIAYFRASVVNGGSTMRIWAADQVIEAAMADAEHLFARSFATSADAYAAMASELVDRRTARTAATGKRGKEVAASSETLNRAAVEDSIIAGVDFIKAAQIAAVKADATLVTAMNEIDQAVRAAVGVAGSLQVARLRTPPRAENSGSIAGLLYDFTVTEATVKGSKKSNQVAKQGLVAWEKAQVLKLAHGFVNCFIYWVGFFLIFYSFYTKKPRLEFSFNVFS